MSRVEIEVLEDVEYLRILREEAERYEEGAGKHATFFGTQTQEFRYRHNKAVGYQMLADVIDFDIKSQPLRKNL